MSEKKGESVTQKSPELQDRNSLNHSTLQSLA